VLGRPRRAGGVGLPATPRFRADSSRGSPALMEDQAVHVVGEVGECQFGLGSGEADRTDEETEAVLVLRKTWVPVQYGSR
jgi:hypothetical protein